MGASRFIRWAILGLAAAMLGACAPAPDVRYKAAVAQKFAGDAKGYYDGLIALAHEAPRSRAGRRARATLRGNDVFADLAVLGAVAAVALPSYLTGTGAASQTEAKSGLRAIGVAQAQYFAEHGRFCRTFAECELTPPSTAHYYYFLRYDEVAGGGDSETTVESEERARDLLRAIKIVPHADATSFLVAAVGNADADTDLDVWIIDERGLLMHIVDDLD